VGENLLLIWSFLNGKTLVKERWLPLIIDQLGGASLSILLVIFSSFCILQCDFRPREKAVALDVFPNVGSQKHFLEVGFQKHTA
jgi:hypothetical protein